MKPEPTPQLTTGTAGPVHKWDNSCCRQTDITKCCLVENRKTVVKATVRWVRHDTVTYTVYDITAAVGVHLWGRVHKSFTANKPVKFKDSESSLSNRVSVHQLCSGPGPIYWINFTMVHFPLLGIS